MTNHSYSLITATKNSSLTLQRTIDSVLAQSFPPKHHIFVDFGSTDDTLAIIQKYITLSSKISISIINQRSQGIYNAWNAGLIHLLPLVENEHSILILNSDDWLCSDFSQLPDLHEGHPVVAASCNAVYHSSSVKRTPRSLLLAPFFMPLIDPALVIKASVYRKHGLYSEAFKVAGDYEYTLRLISSKVPLTRSRRAIVNVQMGGFASQNYQLAAIEAFNISSRYYHSLYALIALLFRWLNLPRPFFFDYL